MSGHIQPAPGSWGTLATLPCLALFWGLGGQASLTLGLVGLGALSVWAVKNYLHYFPEKTDPQEVVIDEALGIWLTIWGTMFFVADTSTPGPGPGPLIVGWAGGFAFFRFFDILKPFPIGWVEKNTQGTFSVLADDVVAAGLALLCNYGFYSLFF